MSETFLEAVARRSALSAETVEAVLERHSVVPSPSPPPARSLRLRRVAFRGTKRIHGVEAPIDFSWSPDGDGIWGITSADNGSGKSSVFQIALWAIRGAPKSVTDTVRGWLGHVEVDLSAGDKRFRVAFEVTNGVGIAGTVSVLGPDDTIHQLLPFGSADAFKRLMSDLMLDALALEPIAAARALGSDSAIAYSDKWLAYTGALLFDSDSDALIGEFITTDLTQRLLQVFLGLPWATTLFQARARRRVADAEALQRRRQLQALGGKSIETLEEELARIDARIAEGATRSRAEADLRDARERYESIAAEIRRLRNALASAEDEVDRADGERRRAQRELLALQEEQAAATFLGRLTPTCCPRCSARITEDRREVERVEGRCSVCSSKVEAPDPAVVDAEINEAQQRVEELTRAERKAKQGTVQVEKALAAAREKLEQAGARLNALSSQGTAADAQLLHIERARIEGALEIVRKILSADQADAVDLTVLKAAEEEAGDRVDETAAAILKHAGDEVARLVVDLGMADVERVVIKRNANVDIHKGGGVSTFRGLSAGERLRLRIATVIALIKSAHQLGAGRHPGLLFIDSPTAEEMQDANVETMLGTLAELARDVPGIQLFVACRGVERTATAVPAGRMLSAESGAKLW
ncbi:hypothetical protein VY88_24915 [Azospirillum thiophilum]|uniref:Uncharacterized protein n=1 Tax=Azospirillum thiophilum TaxID=528244 RepID=A0AAC8W5C1_9PROT|nr:hypothetical protein [Azospirillum thiophilum]ALG75317.1 hypothetical protein AL072_30925 [Azospirillum thiophilum]KJR62232.1 hypothetical protein VY88_24915 [Azospirillum thiophilum]